MNTLREIISEQIKYRSQIFKLAKSNIIKTYSGTMLGWSWAILRPTIFIAIYYVAFNFGLRSGKPVGEYSYFMWLVAGLIPWFYIRDVFTGGAASIRKYKYLVTKIKFPISVIPTIESFGLLLVNSAMILLLAVYFIVNGKGPDIYWLQLPLYIGLMFMFFTTWSLFSGILSVMSKDFLQLIKSLTMALFWLSGIIFEMDNVSNPIFSAILMVNPVTTIISGFRNSLIYKQWFWVEWKQLLLFFLVYAILLGLAAFVYKRLKNDIADVL